MRFVRRCWTSWSGTAAASNNKQVANNNKRALIQIKGQSGTRAKSTVLR